MPQKNEFANILVFIELFFEWAENDETKEGAMTFTSFDLISEMKPRLILDLKMKKSTIPRSYVVWFHSLNIYKKNEIYCRCYDEILDTNPQIRKKKYKSTVKSSLWRLVVRLTFSDDLVE